MNYTQTEVGAMAQVFVWTLRPNYVTWAMSPDFCLCVFHDQIYLFLESHTCFSEETIQFGREIHTNKSRVTWPRLRNLVAKSTQKPGP